jgi:GTP-binding protein
MSATRNKQLFNRAEFFAGAANASGLPKPRGPEIAVIGRSNVGKSSLLNALTTQKKLARVSQTPGRTQQLNFFNVANKFTLVDLPGYGYAAAAKEKKLNWGELSLDYLSTRDVLRRVLLLIDARRGLMPVDLGIMDYLAEHDTPYQIVLTKADVLKPDELKEVLHAVGETLRLGHADQHEIIVTSAEANAGMDNLRAAIIDAVEKN